MERALLAERYPLSKRTCPELGDSDFVRLGVLRGLSAVDSGRHFLQNIDEIYDESLPHSTYFKSLKSSRRTSMLEVVEQQSYQLHCETLQAERIDYLKQFPELDEYTVDAADGHFIEYACHTEKGKIQALKATVAMKPMTLHFLSLITATLKQRNFTVL